MADWPAKKNAQLRIAFPIYDADGDLVTAAAGLDSEVSSSGPSEGAFSTFIDCTNEATEIATGSGVYELLLTAGEMNDDAIAVLTKSSTGGSKDAVNVIYTATRQLLDLAFPATSGRSFIVETDGMIHADVKEWLGIAPSALNSGAVQADVQRWLNAVPNALISSRVDCSVGAMAANTLDAAAIAADAITAAKIAADVTTEFRSLLTGTSDAGGSATTMVDAARTELIDVFVGAIILFTSGAIANQARLITDFNAVTDTITFAPAVTAAVGAGFTYEILPNAGVDVQSWVGLLTALVTPSALVSGRVDVTVGAMQANVLDAAAIAADAITAAKVAADVHAEAADAVWDEDIVAAHGAADAAGRAIRTLDAIGDRTNNSNLNALLGVPDTAGIDMVDEIFVRDIDLFEAAAAQHSLCTAVLKAVSRVVDNAGSLETYRTDGTTLVLAQAITVNASADPIDELGVGT